MEPVVEKIPETTTFRQKVDITPRTKWTRQEIAAFIARMSLAAVWIFAGVSRSLPSNRVSVIQSVQAYDIFSYDWSVFIGNVIGPLEVIGGVLLVIGVVPRITGLVSAVVLSLFIVGIAQAWARGLVIDCGCFGQTEISDNVERDYALTIIRDVALVAMSLIVAYWPHRLAVASIGAGREEVVETTSSTARIANHAEEPSAGSETQGVDSATDSYPEAVSGAAGADSEVVHEAPAEENK